MPDSETVTTAATRAPVRVFVAAAGNSFMTDIAGWITEAATLGGRNADLVTGRLPIADGSINLVVAPHEFFELFDASAPQLRRAAAASICVGTEQPGTQWFDLSLDACRRGLMSLDISVHGTEALRREGLRAERLPLGAVPSMTASDGSERPRHLDVVFMGGHDPRRGAILADLAPRLVHRHCDLRLFRFDRPVSATTPGIVAGADKYDLLSRATILVNLHRDRPVHAGVDQDPYFEWARLLEAMANRCVVVTEPSVGHAPLVAGRDFIECEAGDMADVIDDLLDDPRRTAQIANQAYGAVTGELALAGALGPLLDEIDRTVLPRLGAHVRASSRDREPWRLGASKQPPVRRLGEFRPFREQLRTAKQLVLDENQALRRLDAAKCLVDHGARIHVERVETPAYGRADPTVSVVVTLYDYATVVTETLDSIAASDDIEFEIVIVEDHATDDSRAVVVDYLSAHPEVPALLLAKDANQGLAAARNTGFAAARGAYVMVMDADNHLYPTCLRRLVDTLEADHDASAAYAILEDFGAARDVRSEIAWEPSRLCAANYIDAQAMWRRADWERLGGYRDDDQFVFGWEDWDLWLRLAASGGYATLRREILGRYRVQASSMITVTNLFTDDALESIRARYPTLPWPT